MWYINFLLSYFLCFPPHLGSDSDTHEFCMHVYVKVLELIHPLNLNQFEGQVYTSNQL